MSGLDQAAPKADGDTFVSTEMLTWVFDRMDTSVAKMREHHADHDVIFGASEAVSAMRGMVRLIPVVARVDLAAPSAPAEVEGLMERVTSPGGPRTIVGENSIIADQQATIARLTKERDEAREKNGVMIEKAAKVCDDEAARRRKQAADLAATGNVNERNVTQHARWTAGALALELAAADVRALDPDATAAIAARDQRVRETETRACAEIVGAAFEGMHIEQTRRAILARLGQPKAESGE